MKIISLIFYLLIAQFIAIGQVNLVSNPSVEGYDGSSTCQTVQHNGYQFQSVKADMAKITGWSTVDYYRGSCKDYLPTPDRLCNGGHTGDGYLQMSIGADGRWELMCSELTSSTIPGHRYYFEYFIRTAPGTGHSSSHSQVGVYLSQNKAKQSASCILNGRYQTYVNGMQLFVPSNFTISEDWQIVSGVFTSIGNYSWLNVGAFDDNALLLHYDDFMLVDLGPMEEECPAIKYLQNQSFYSTNLLKANHTLLAGYNVGAPFPASNGNVVIKDYSYTVFKAGHQISIEPGFTTELNANFLAYISPCSSNPCDAQNLPDKTINFCGTTGQIDDALFTDFSKSNGGNIRWQGPYITDPYAVYPKFVPPSGQTHGVVEYVVYYVDPCGGVSTQKVIFSYTIGPEAPTLQIANILPMEYTLEFDVLTHAKAEWVQYQIVNKQTNSTVFSDFLYPGSDFTAGSWFTLEGMPYPTTSVCYDYEIRISTKNVCYPDVLTEVFDWNRSAFCNPKPQILVSPNVFTPDGDGINDCYAPTVCGADLVDFDVKNRWGGQILSVTNQVVFSSTPCLWNGGSQSDGEYIIEYTVKGCGSTIKQYPMTITLIR